MLLSNSLRAFSSSSSASATWRKQKTHAQSMRTVRRLNVRHMAAIIGQLFADSRRQMREEAAW
jgi:hypothetical protein